MCKSFINAYDYNNYLFVNLRPLHDRIIKTKTNNS